MEKFVASLQDPFWWLSVVIVGVIVSVIGSIAFRILESVVSRYSERAREAEAERLKARDQRIKRLQNSQHALYMAGIDDLRNRMRNLQYVVFALFLFFIGIFGLIGGTMHPFVGTTLYMVAALSVMVGWRYGLKAALTCEEIAESEQELTNNSNRRQQAGAAE